MTENGKPTEEPLSEPAMTLVLIATDALKTGGAIRRDLLEIMRQRMGIRDDEMRHILMHIGEAHIKMLREEYTE